MGSAAKKKQQNAEMLRGTLREAGLRATAARVSVLRCLFEADRPLSHAEVCERLEGSGFDRATLYRNLSDLTQAGLASRRDLGDHVWRFEARNEDDGHSEEAHPHFICVECGDVSCLPEDAIAIAPKAAVPSSVASGKIEVQVRGTCDECV